MSKNFREEIKKKIRESLQEHPYNPVWVGSQAKGDTITFYWQPHEYRLYFNFEKANFNPKKPTNPALENIQTRVPGFNQGYTYAPKNHNSEHHYKGFMGCTIIVRKNTIEVINNMHRKQWREINADSIEDIDKRIDEVIDKLNSQAIKALETFIKIHKGKTNFEPIKIRCYNGIHNDELVPKIPKEMIIKDGVFQKLYKEKIELYTPTQVKTFFKNRVIEQLAPQIANEIKGLGIFMSDEFTPVLKEFSEQIKTHLEVQKKTLQTLENINNFFAKKKKKPRKKRKPRKRCKYGLTDLEMKILRGC